ncbi:MAG: OmpH family outer membrane protein [Pelagibacterales bacterium]|nr:OmpH family outer membrane protein [Pelagibacterales bacterium]
MRIIVLSFLALLSFNAFAETLKIGYIDTDQVVNNLPQYQQNVDKLSNEFEPKKQELLDLFNHIELLRAKIIINESENKENLQGELSKLMSLEESFKQETEFWQVTMNNRKVELLQKIELLINNTINELAISESYDLILYENAAFVSDKVNITNKVIERIQKLEL